jgi:hypothetical protein
VHRSKSGPVLSLYPLMTAVPAPQPWDAPDPLPVMRRELLLLIETSRLRDEVERLRAAEQEARYLSASVDHIMESRDQDRCPVARAFRATGALSKTPVLRRHLDNLNIF